MSRADAEMTVDWFRLLWDLVQRGYSFSEIGRKTGIPEMTIRSYRDGGQPVYWRGKKLVSLWCAVCDSAEVDVPQAELVIMPRVVKRQAEVVAEDAAVHRLEDAWAGGSEEGRGGEE